jgi:glycosyl transferase family 25
VAEKLKPFQLLPAIARQEQRATSDIKHWRVADRGLSPALIRREIVRAYYETRLLPRQIAAVLKGTAHLAKVANAKLAPENATPAFYPEAQVLLRQRRLA